MSDVYREPSADAPSTGERLWSRSARGSILSVVFLVASGLLGLWLYVSDPRNAGPPAFLMGGFSVAVLFVWVISSRNAIVAIYERGLRVGWLGGRTQFVPWEEVTRVEDVLTRSTTAYYGAITTETAHVHCRGEAYAVSNRFVGGKSFVAARKELGAHVRPECFEHSAIGFDPPSRLGLVGWVLLWLSALLLLAVGIALAHDAWIWFRQTVAPHDPSRGVTLHYLVGPGELMKLFASSAVYAAVTMAVYKRRASRSRARQPLKRP